MLVVNLDFTSMSKFWHSFCPKPVGAVLKAVVLSWEDKFGNGSPPGSAIFLLVFPPLQNVGIYFAMSLWGEVLDAVVLSWEGIFGHNLPPCNRMGCLLYGWIIIRWQLRRPRI